MTDQEFLGVVRNVAAEGSQVHNWAISWVCVNAIMALHGLPNVPLEEWREIVGPVEMVDAVSAARKIFISRRWVI